MNHHHHGGHHGGGFWPYQNWGVAEYVPYPADFSSDDIPWGWVAVGSLAGIVLALLVKR